MANDTKAPKATETPTPVGVDASVKKIAEFLKGAVKDGETVADAVIRVVTEQGNAIKTLGAERDRWAAEAKAAHAALKSADERSAKLVAELEKAKVSTSGGRAARVRHEPA